MKKKWLLSIVLAGLLAILGACGSSDNNDNKNNDNNNNGEETAGEADMPEPDLDDIPDVVAEVNGESIEKDEFKNVYEGQFQQMAMQAQMSGEEIDQDDLKKQTADLIINQELVLQEAENRDYEVSDDDVDELLKDIMEQQGAESKDDFFDQLEEQDVEKDDFMDDIKKQVMLNQLIDEEAGDTEPSDKEVKDFYEQYKEQQAQADVDEEDMESLDDLKPEIVEQLKKQKENEAMQTLVEKLREDGDIKNHLS
ncbi:MAG TPA: SurA N-terminal domain-containing protein [Bacillota bacterium]|nr:SurA N-terminal domain-containing protein [Bacillota bacterium]